MDETRLKRLGAELAKARKRRDEWEAKVKDLERRYKEAENTCIHNMVHEANLTPEQLSELIRAAAAGMIPGVPALQKMVGDGSSGSDGAMNTAIEED